MSISTIYNMGDDAHANLYYLQFTSLPTGVSSDTDLQILSNRIDRATKVTIPEKTTPTSKINFQGNSVDIILGREEIVQETTFEIRIDSNWEYYQALMSWMNLLSQGKERGYITSSNIYRENSTLTVTLLNKGFVEINQGWKFHNAYPKKIPQVSLDYSSGDPIILPITIGFSHFELGV